MKEQEEKKYEARIRRMIKGTKRRGSTVPESVHKLWSKGKKARRELAKILLECAGDKARTLNHAAPCIVLRTCDSDDITHCRKPLRRE